MAAQLVTEIIAMTIAALLLDHDFLLTPLMLNLPIGLLCLIILFVMRADSPAENGQSEEGARKLGSVKQSIHVLVHLLRQRKILVLLATVPVAKMVNPLNELMLQYIPRKFNMSLASVCF
jgi:hypothetical protein